MFQDCLEKIQNRYLILLLCFMTVWKKARIVISLYCCITAVTPVFSNRTLKTISLCTITISFQSGQMRLIVRCGLYVYVFFLELHEIWVVLLIVRYAL